MTTSTLTLAGFLLARIADDEAVAREALRDRDEAIAGGRIRTVADAEQRGTPYGDRALSVETFSSNPVILTSPERVLAECESKRAIVEDAMRFGDDGYYAADYMPSRASEGRDGEIGGRRVYPGHPNYEQVAALSRTLLALAQPYASHPDFRDEWRA